MDPIQLIAHSTILGMPKRALTDRDRRHRSEAIEARTEKARRARRIRRQQLGERARSLGSRVWRPSEPLDLSHLRAAVEAVESEPALPDVKATGEVPETIHDTRDREPMLCG